MTTQAQKARWDETLAKIAKVKSKPVKLEE
jgi:hypothetical protein